MSRDPRIVRYAFLFFLTAVFASVGHAEGIRVAVIAGQDANAPKASVVALVEASLSRQADFILLERAQVKRILAEQRLSAAGLTDPAQAVRLGQILKVDLFLFLDGPSEEALAAPKGAPPLPRICRVRVIEARSGLILGAGGAEEKALEEKQDYVMDLLRQTVLKLRVPAVERRYVALLDFRSEDPGRALEGLAEMLGGFLLTDLATSPNIMVLDRENLRQLKLEETVAGAATDIRASTTLLQGGVKRIFDKNELVIGITFRSLADKKEQRLTVTVPAGDMSEVRAGMAKLVVTQLRAQPTTRAAGSPQQEAQAFLRRADMELRFSGERVAPLIEAAAALDPSDSGQLQAAGRFDRLREWHFRAAEEKFGYTFDSDNILKALRAMVREAELSAAVSHSQAARWREKKAGSFLPRFGFRRENTDDFSLYVRSLKEPALRELLATWGQIKIAEYRELLSLTEESWRAGGDPEAWLLCLQFGLGEFGYWACSDGEEWQRLVQEAVGKLTSPPLKVPDNPRNPHAQQTALRLGLWHCFPQLEEHLSRDNPPGMDPKKMHPGARKVFDWLMQQPQPGVRIYATFAAVDRGWGTVSDAQKGCDIIAVEVARAKPSLELDLTDDVDDYATDVIDRLLLRIKAWELDEDNLPLVVPCVEKIVRPLMKPESVKRLVAWRRAIEIWIDALEEIGRLQEAYSLAGQYVSLLNSTTLQGDWEPHRKAALKQAQESLASLAKELGPAAAPPPVLGSTAAGSAPPGPVEPSVPAIAASGQKGEVQVAGFTVRRMEFGSLAFGHPVAMYLDGDRIAALLLGKANEQSFSLQVVKLPLNGGPEEVLAEGKVNIPSHRLDRGSYCLQEDGRGTWYAVLSGIGLVALRKDGAKLWTEENGLATSKLTAMGCLDGKVYLGVEPGAVIEFNPATSASATVCSSRSQEHRNPLDGTTPYKVSEILPDPVRKCLWISVMSRGLWRYVPASGALTLELPGPLDRCRWYRGYILSNQRIFDPETSQGHSLWKDDPSGQSHWQWPIAFLGDRIVSVLSSNGVSIRPMDGRGPVNVEFVSDYYVLDLGDLREWGDAVVAMSSNNPATFWIIRAPDGPDGAQRLQAWLKDAFPKPQPAAPRSPSTPRERTAKPPGLTFSQFVRIYIFDPRIGPALLVGAGVAGFFGFRAWRKRR